MTSTVIRLRRAASLFSTLHPHRTPTPTLTTFPSNESLPRNSAAPLASPVSSLTGSSTSSFPPPIHRCRLIHGSLPEKPDSDSEEEEEADATEGARFDGEFGCNDWLVIMKFPDEEEPWPKNTEEMVEFYLLTLAKVVGSVEEAKKRMYYYSTASYTAFYAKIDDETSKQLKGMPGVVSVLPNSYGNQFSGVHEGALKQKSNSSFTCPTKMLQAKSGPEHLSKKEEENNGSVQEVKSLSESDPEQQIVWEQESDSKLLKVKRDVGKRLKSYTVETIDILDEDVIDEVKLWKNSVIAYTLGERVPHGAMVRFVKQKLKNITASQVLPHAKGFYILRFDTEEEKRAMMEVPRRFNGKKLLVLRPWEPDLDIDQVCIYQFPTWVQFPDLKLQFWGDKALNKIASTIGVPLSIDPLTAMKKRLAYARVLIDVDVSKEPAKEVTLKCPNGEMVQQPVVYERLRRMCPKCKVWDLVDEHRCDQWQKVKESKSTETCKEELTVEQPAAVVS